MPPVKIVVANQRGGVGKTITALGLSMFLALRGLRTLLIDADCQGSIGTMLRLRPQHRLADFLIRQYDLSLCVSSVGSHLDVICGDRRTADAERQIANEIARERVIEDALAPYDSDYQAVVLDVGPSVNQIQTCSMVYARNVIVPVNMDLVSVSGAAACVQFCEMLSKALRSQIRPVAFLPTMVDKRLGMTRVVQGLMGELSERFHIPILPEIRTDATVGKATQAGKFLFDFDPNCKAATDYANACGKLMEVLEHADAQQIIVP